jgi:hypothetical protein
MRSLIQLLNNYRKQDINAYNKFSRDLDKEEKSRDYTKEKESRDYTYRSKISKISSKSDTRDAWDTPSSLREASNSFKTGKLKGFDYLFPDDKDVTVENPGPYFSRNIWTPFLDDFMKHVGVQYNSNSKGNSIHEYEAFTNRQSSQKKTLSSTPEGNFRTFEQEIFVPKKKFRINKSTDISVNGQSSTLTAGLYNIFYELTHIAPAYLRTLMDQYTKLPGNKAMPREKDAAEVVKLRLEKEIKGELDEEEMNIEKYLLHEDNIDTLYKLIILLIESVFKMKSSYNYSYDKKAAEREYNKDAFYRALYNIDFNNLTPIDTELFNHDSETSLSNEQIASIPQQPQEQTHSLEQTFEIMFDILTKNLKAYVPHLVQLQKMNGDQLSSARENIRIIMQQFMIRKKGRIEDDHKKEIKKAYWIFVNVTLMLKAIYNLKLAILFSSQVDWDKKSPAESLKDNYKLLRESTNFERVLYALRRGDLYDLHMIIPKELHSESHLLKGFLLAFSDLEFREYTPELIGQLNELPLDKIKESMDNLRKLFGDNKSVQREINKYLLGYLDFQIGSSGSSWGRRLPPMRFKLTAERKNGFKLIYELFQEIAYFIGDNIEKIKELFNKLSMGRKFESYTKPLDFDEESLRRNRSFLEISSASPGPRRPTP